MRHRSHKITLDRKTGPRRALLKTLVEQVILFEKVTTTTAKAKAVRPLVERLVTHGKKTDIASFRYLLQRLPTPLAARKVRDVLGPRFKDRAGGYTRIVKVGNRRGDGADIARIEFVELSPHVAGTNAKEKK